MKFKPLIYGTLSAMLLAGCYAGEDSKQGSAERMKNATATIVTGIAAQQTYGDSVIDATVQRPAQFDSEIVGETTPDTIEVRMKIPLKDNVFRAERNIEGYLQGGQDKRMFDWSVEQVTENSYKIDRVGFDGLIDIFVKDGQISGKYHKPWGLDFSFDGEIMDNGGYELRMDIPMAFDWSVKGTITPK